MQAKQPVTPYQRELCAKMILTSDGASYIHDAFRARIVSFIKIDVLVSIVMDYAEVDPVNEVREHMDKYFLSNNQYLALMKIAAAGLSTTLDICGICGAVHNVRALVAGALCPDCARGNISRWRERANGITFP